MLLESLFDVRRAFGDQPDLFWLEYHLGALVDDLSLSLHPYPNGLEIRGRVDIIRVDFPVELDDFREALIALSPRCERCGAEWNRAEERCSSAACTCTRCPFCRTQCVDPHGSCPHLVAFFFEGDAHIGDSVELPALEGDLSDADVARMFGEDEALARAIWRDDFTDAPTDEGTLLAIASASRERTATVCGVFEGDGFGDGSWCGLYVEAPVAWTRALAVTLDRLRGRIGRLAP